MNINDYLKLHVFISNDSSDNFYKEFLCRYTNPFPTSSLQNREDEHLCALDNLGCIADHHGNIDTAKAEEHAHPYRFRLADSDIYRSIHGMVN